jgi:hypothetical protein
MQDTLAHGRSGRSTGQPARRLPVLAGDLVDDLAVAVTRLADQRGADVLVVAGLGRGLVVVKLEIPVRAVRGKGRAVWVALIDINRSADFRQCSDRPARARADRQNAERREGEQAAD